MKVTQTVSVSGKDLILTITTPTSVTNKVISGLGAYKSPSKVRGYVCLMIPETATLEVQSK